MSLSGSEVETHLKNRIGGQTGFGSSVSAGGNRMKSGGRLEDRQAELRRTRYEHPAVAILQVFGVDFKIHGSNLFDDPDHLVRGLDQGAAGGDS